MSGTAPSEPRPFLRLLDGRDKVERLPAGMASRWPTWVLEPDGTFVGVPDGTSDAEAGVGFVNPESCDDLWMASDLPPPTSRLCLGLHVRDGTLRHVFPAVDMGVRGFRNRGMRTVPRAHSWLTFGASLPADLQLFAAGQSVDATPTLSRGVEALATNPPEAGPHTGASLSLQLVVVAITEVSRNTHPPFERP